MTRDSSSATSDKSKGDNTTTTTSSKTSRSSHNDGGTKGREKRDTTILTKVVIRRLPPTMTEEEFLEQISPVPEHDFRYFVKGDMGLGQHAFSRAYLNFTNNDEIFIFKDKFDGYVFLDEKGNEYPGIVEFAPFQKIPKRRAKKRDPKCGTIEQDPDYLKFLESLENPEEVTLPSLETYIEEIETREKEMKANNGVLRVTTPLIEYLQQKKMEKQKLCEERREERKRRELERKRIREEEKRKRKAEKEKILESKGEESNADADPAGNTAAGTPTTPTAVTPTESSKPVKVLKNPVREKEQDIKEPISFKKVISKTPQRERVRRDWERPRERSNRTKEYSKSYTSSNSASSSSANIKESISPERRTSEKSDKMDNAEPNDYDDSPSGKTSKHKDPRTERRIRNKDRPSLEIYRPGMRRINSKPQSNDDNDSGKGDV